MDCVSGNLPDSFRFGRYSSIHSRLYTALAPLPVRSNQYTSSSTKEGYLAPSEKVASITLQSSFQFFTRIAGDGPGVRILIRSRVEDEGNGALWEDVDHQGWTLSRHLRVSDFIRLMNWVSWVIANPN